MDSRDISQNSKLSSDDMEPDPKLDSARDVDQNPKLDSAQFFIESNQTTNKAGQMTGFFNAVALNSQQLFFLFLKFIFGNNAFVN